MTSIASLIVLSACSETVADVQSIDSVCHPDISVEGCESLNGKTLSIRGYLMESEFLNRPHLVQRREDIGSYTEDAETFALGIELMVSIADQYKYENFLGKEVSITGELDTDCPPIMAASKAQMAADIQSDSDIIRVPFISGKCHYFTNAIFDVSTVEIKIANP